MVKISKELFVEMIEEIQKGLNKKEEFNDAMEKFTSTYFASTVGNEWLEALLKLLADNVGDKDDGYGTMIEWFIYEDVEKKVYLAPNSKFNSSNQELEIDVSTPELLYDYFVMFGENDE
jgi:hypothetical protein